MTELQQRLAGGGDLDAASQADEEPFVEFVLEQENLTADRRLRDVQPRAGRDSSLVRLMSRSAKPARALKRAPGRLWSAKTIDVLLASCTLTVASPERSRGLAMTQNRVMLSAKS